MGQTGRNAPCPCGSGKKYKKCCLPKDTEALRPQQTYHDYALEVADSLRQKILQFMKKRKYDRYIEEAFDFYWQTLDPELDPPEVSHPGYIQFLDWFIHDYPIPAHERPVIQLFWESKPILPAEEMQVLQDWQEAHISVFQIKEVKPEQGILAEDIFTGEEVFISDCSLSRGAKKWELATLRKIKVLDEWQASSVGSRESPSAKEEIYDLIMGLFRVYQEHIRGVTLQDFLRDSGFMLHQRGLTLQARPPQPPKLLTSSGEELTFWEARYELAGLPKAISKLESQEDFCESELEEDDQGQISKIVFEWLEKGKSVRKIKGILRQSGHKLDSFFSPGPGQEGARILGTVTLQPNQLILEAKGEKRFAIGKERLERLLAGLLQHRLDSVKSVEEMLREHPPGENLADVESEIPQETRQALLKEVLDQHYQKWLDTPLPALNGKTPRKAIKTKDGSRLVEDLLRLIEYDQRDDLKYDISWIRKELGL